ncbi:MAG: DUF58 domain-containing protein [Pseudomonadota bacterium]
MSLLPEINELLELRHGANTIGLASRHRVNSLLSGLYASVFRGQGMDFEEVREYRHGDEIRNMDWRVTARTGLPHLKVFREERERAVVLAVDVGPHMQFGTRSTFKNVQAARAAALVGWAATGNHDRVGALLYGDGQQGLHFLAPRRGRQGLWRLLRSLTHADVGNPVSGKPLEEALDKLTRSAPTGALLFVIGDFNRRVDSLEIPLGRLRQRHDLVLMPVDDPADHSMPPVGRVLFQDAGDDSLEVDTDSLEGRQKYRERWLERRDALGRLCQRLGIALIPVSTAEDVHGSLVRGLRLRARQLVR